MKRHLTASAVSIDTRHERGAAGCVADRASAAFNNNARSMPASSERSLALADARAWTHTLILTGELNRGSAHALEAEIERLCDKGVTGITLDLRELTCIDSIGVAVIAFRSGLCKRRGYDFAVIAGSRLVHGALEQAGVTDLHPFQGDDIVARRGDREASEVEAGDAA
jgi:anti-anti-sigma factor